MISEHYEGFESRWLIVDAGRVHVRTRTDEAPAGALPAVLVHGLGISSRHWIPAARLLARSHPVYAPDLPGYGISDKPRGTPTLVELSDVLADVMDGLGLGPSVVLGISFGCQIVIDLAARTPEKVAAAVLISPTMDPSIGPVEHFVRLVTDGPREPLALFPVIFRDYIAFGVPRALATFNDAYEDPVEDTALDVEAPTLIIRGGRDPVVTQAWVERLTGLLPNGRLHVIPGAAHATNFNSAEEVIEVVEAFLREESVAQ